MVVQLLIVAQAVIKYLEDRPIAYVNEIQQFLYNTFNELEVLLTSIKRLLTKRRQSRKVVRARAQERSKPLRVKQLGIAITYDSDQLIFLNKSALNKRTSNRKYGWSLVGVDCTISRPIKRLERQSILLALTISSYIEQIIFQGSITADLYLKFVVEKVLPHCTLYPGPQSVLIMDNASIHRDSRLQQACDDAGVLLLFLPLYLLDYNPIEATFKDLKAWIRRNYFLAEEFKGFAQFLEFAIRQVCYRDVRGHFTAVGYIV